jgi:P-type Mg2+ transporter
VPFDFERRRVSVLVDDGSARLLVVKAAPEDIIEPSVDYAMAGGEQRTLDEAERQRLLQRFEGLGEEGYRALGVASRAMPRSHDNAIVSDETGLTFAGFALFVDPPKTDAATAIQALADVGVEVKILTGDNERITRHICREIGVEVSGVLTGKELALLTEDALRARLPSAAASGRSRRSESSWR